MSFKTLFIDLDDTVYPSSSGVWDAIAVRIDEYMQKRMGFSPVEIPFLRKTLFSTYGTTLRGLQIEYGVDVKDFLAYVHDVPINKLIKPDLFVRESLQNCKQRKIIFTNADVAHAQRVLRVMGLEDCFETIIDILAISPYCKPQKEAYQTALKVAGEDDAHRCVVVDDAPRNLKTARSLGFFTVWVGGIQPIPEADVSIAHISDLSAVL